jgi:hypothetical protein
MRPCVSVLSARLAVVNVSSILRFFSWTKEINTSDIVSKEATGEE